jgi:hypothetical protein
MILTGKLYLDGEFDSYTYFYPNNISDYTVSAVFTFIIGGCRRCPLALGALLVITG